jgi:hypothetical protein
MASAYERVYAQAIGAIDNVDAERDSGAAAARLEALARNLARGRQPVESDTPVRHLNGRNHEAPTRGMSAHWDRSTPHG